MNQLRRGFLGNESMTSFPSGSGERRSEHFDAGSVTGGLTGLVFGRLTTPWCLVKEAVTYPDSGEEIDGHILYDTLDSQV
mmetsp:Transcript_14654/g.22767  ORF Transcript_14654/g.22767 Transcript_14654/m.22767 type:complete len:80 (-) Transcript_14654:47-286(-)